MSCAGAAHSGNPDEISEYLQFYFHPGVAARGREPVAAAARDATAGWAPRTPRPHTHSHSRPLLAAIHCTNAVLLTSEWIPSFLTLSTSLIIAMDASCGKASQLNE